MKTCPTPLPSSEREALIARSNTALACLPDSQYKYMLTQLHTDMLAADAPKDAPDDLTIAYLDGHARGVQAGIKRAQQVPLTDFELGRLWVKFVPDEVPHNSFACAEQLLEAALKFARAIEAHHNIKDPT